MSERSRRDTDAITNAEWAFLNDVADLEIAPRDLWELAYDFDGRTGRLWRRYGGAVLDGWVQRHPATRPRLWWRFDAPRDPAGAPRGARSQEVPAEPRRRLGGIGQALHETTACVARFEFGIAVDWLTIEIAKRIPGVPIDEQDPPRFESEATYLERHGLLRPSEKATARRLIRQEAKRESARASAKPTRRSSPKPKARRSPRAKPKVIP